MVVSFPAKFAWDYSKVPAKLGLFPMVFYLSYNDNHDNSDAHISVVRLVMLPGTPHNVNGTPFNVSKQYHSLQRLTNIATLVEFLMLSSSLLYRVTDLNKKLDLYIVLVTFGRFGIAFVSCLILMYFTQFAFLVIFGHTVSKGFWQEWVTELIT